MDKPAIIRALLASLQEDVARASDAAERTRGDAIHDEARPENDKDTRALETSYLARGQAQRVADLEEACKRVAFMEVRDFGPEDAIGLSALILLEVDGQARWYLLAAAGGGRSIQHAGTTIEVLTPQAPLGRALAGRVRGDDLELKLGARQRELSILDLR
jgi:hypothetical protein